MRGEKSWWTITWLSIPATAQVPIEGIDTIEPAYEIPGKWITESEREMAEVYGYTVIDALSVIVTHMSEVIKRHIHELVSRQDINIPAPERG